MLLKTISTFAFILVAGLVGALALLSRPSSSSASLKILSKNGGIGATLVFRGEQLNDLVRLLKPMKLNGSDGEQLFLQDAVYEGATGGIAQLLTVWTTDLRSVSQTVLTSQDIGKAPSAVADELNKKAPDPSTTLAVIPVEVVWKDFVLSVNQRGSAAIRGKDSSKFPNSIFAKPRELAKTKTHLVNIPIGYNQEAFVAIQAWFQPSAVILYLSTPSFLTVVEPPEVSALSGVPGAIIDSQFVNEIYFAEASRRTFELGKEGSGIQLGGLSIISEEGSLRILGDLKPSPPRVRFEANFEGSDLKFTGVKPTEISCTDLSSDECFKLNIRVKALALLVSGKFKGTNLRTDDIEPLGTFYVGSKPMSGIGKVDRVRASNGKLIVQGTIRLNGAQ